MTVYSASTSRRSSTPGTPGRVRERTPFRPRRSWSSKWPGSCTSRATTTCSAPLPARLGPPEPTCSSSATACSRRLERLAGRLGLRPGPLCRPRPARGRAVASARLRPVVHASRHEGLARVLPQALLSGRPVVSYDVDGAGEVVRTGETGLLVAPGDWRGLARALDTLVSDRLLRRALGERPGICRTRFDHRRMVDALEKVYLAALEPRRKLGRLFIQTRFIKDLTLLLIEASEHCGGCRACVVSFADFMIGHFVCSTFRHSHVFWLHPSNMIMAPRINLTFLLSPSPRRRRSRPPPVPPEIQGPQGPARHHRPAGRRAGRPDSRDPRPRAAAGPRRNRPPARPDAPRTVAESAPPAGRPLDARPAAAARLLGHYLPSVPSPAQPGSAAPGRPGHAAQYGQGRRQTRGPTRTAFSSARLPCRPWFSATGPWPSATVRRSSPCSSRAGLAVSPPTATPWPTPTSWSVSTSQRPWPPAPTRTAQRNALAVQAGRGRLGRASAPLAAQAAGRTAAFRPSTASGPVPARSPPWSPDRWSTARPSMSASASPPSRPRRWPSCSTATPCSPGNSIPRCPSRIRRPGLRSFDPRAPGRPAQWAADLAVDHLAAAAGENSKLGPAGTRRFSTACSPTGEKSLGERRPGGAGPPRRANRSSRPTAWSNCPVRTRPPPGRPAAPSSRRPDFPRNVVARTNPRPPGPLALRSHFVPAAPHVVPPVDRRRLSISGSSAATARPPPKSAASATPSGKRPANVSQGGRTNFRRPRAATRRPVRSKPWFGSRA